MRPMCSATFNNVNILIFSLHPNWIYPKLYILQIGKFIFYLQAWTRVASKTKHITSVKNVECSYWEIYNLAFDRLVIVLCVKTKRH